MNSLTNNKILDNKYEFVRVLKKGGFGIVYYGIDKELNKPVAIKEIAPSFLEDPKYLDMFQEEALNIAKLSHNNIVHIYELKKTIDGMLYIIMEYIDGIDLEKILRRARRSDRSIPIHIAVYIIAQICMALDYAHYRRDALTNTPLNLVHQDVSPSNIMISRHGDVKLIDFGIASVRKHQTKEKLDSKIRGKIPYLAPEQIMTGNHPDPRSDLFSLGLVLYETLTKERLFRSKEEIIEANRNAKWLKRALKGKKIPSRLEKILSKALEIDIPKRYQIANHMYIDLLQYLISCNETGELMDNLADFIRGLFDSDKLPEPNNYVESDSIEIGSDSEQYSSSQSISYQWDADLRFTNHESTPTHKTQPFSPDGNDISHLKRLSTTEFEEDEDEDLKTVIDGIRISARNQKKRVIQVSIAALVAVILFGVFDTINGWTRFGIWVYDWLFPPAIEVLTVPPNAQVFLDGKKIKGQTPIPIDKISPGVHRLKLSVEGYRPIVKSIFVPREGEIRVQGEYGNENSLSYLFSFNTEIDINSFPPRALVYINGIRFNQKTPCTVSWEVGVPLSIELELNGFERLSEFTLNTVEGIDEVNNSSLWESSVTNEPYIKYSVNGTLRKRVFIETIPDRVEIYTDNNRSLTGITGIDKSIMLTAGSHKLIFRKKKFIAKRINLKIDENFNKKVTAVLSRRVRFTAYDSLDRLRKDLGASLVSLKRGSNNIIKRRKKTPFEMILPAYEYAAEFQKSGYEKKIVKFGTYVQQVRVEMKPTTAIVEVTVLDGLTDQPITSAAIFYNFIGKSPRFETLLNYTDAIGETFGELTEGNYIFTVKKPGYNILNKNLSTRAGATHKLVFKIYPAN